MIYFASSKSQILQIAIIINLSALFRREVAFFKISL